MLYKLPALIDPHVHFRTPGAEHKENWISGAQAAINGGVTTVFDMPNNTPSCCTFERLMQKKALIQEQLNEAGIPLRYSLYFGADRQNIQEIPKSKGHVIGIKIFMGSSTGSLLIDDEATLDEIFRMAADLDMIVSVHAEDEAIIRENKSLYPTTDPAMHSVIRSREAAIKAVTRAIDLSQKHGTELCILHVGSKEEVELIRQAKKEGIRVYGETSPHHLLLSVDDYAAWGNLVQVNPPLREKEDQQCLWNALNLGILDFIGTDHAPHTLEEKQKPYGQSPSGIPSIDLLLPLLLNAVNQQKMTLDTLVKVTRTNIEKIFRLPANDDFVVVDLNMERMVTDEQLKTKCGWSPYRGKLLKGWPIFIHQDQHLTPLEVKYAN